MWFAIKTLFKFIFTLLTFGTDKRKYNAFRQISGNKHFYDWQWKLLDRIYK